VATSEENVISAICKNKDFHLVVGESNELFGPFADIFDFMKDYYLKHKAVPEATLIEQRFKEVDLPVTTAPTAFYLDELRNNFVRGRMQEIMLKASSAMKETSPPEVLDRLSTALAKLGRFTSNVRDINIADADWAREHLERLREKAEANEGTPGIATGFKSIDSAYPSGLAGGHSIVLMGYTGRGKSMFADVLAAKVHEQGYKPMIVSLEMSPEEQMERLYAIMSSGLFKISDLSRGDISLDDFDNWSRKRLDKNKQFVVVSSEGISEVTPNIVQAKIDTHRPDIVILDYLQLMKDNGKTSQMTPRMLNLSSEVKRLAMSNNIPIVSITAVTDEDGDKRDSPPVLSQISWSSAIEYDANLAIAIHRYDESDLVEVVCRKNRHGGMFDFYFDVDFNAGIWQEKFHL
jgi:replicative DNA helicase